MFRWHDSASLFAGTDKVARSTSVMPAGFRNIPAQPNLTALTDLTNALIARDAFCISDTPLPAGFAAAPPDFLTLTGGSTGSPKVIQRSQSSWIASFEVNRASFGMQQLRSLAVLGHLSHSLSLYGVLEGLHIGLDVHVLDHASPRQQLSALRDSKIGVLYATPAQLRLLARVSTAPLPDVELLFCGGGTLDAATTQSVKHQFPNANLRQFYGAAETSFITMTDDQTLEGSVGKAFPGVEIKIDEGEIWVRSPYLFKGYAFGNPMETRWKAGYVSVGELGRMDSLGNLWITGRKSRLINIADQLVSPEAVENHVMHLHPGSLCAALPVADAARGHRLELIVEGPDDPTCALAIKDICRAQFGPLIAPRRVHFHPQLPLLASGKINLGRLSEWLEERQ